MSNPELGENRPQRPHVENDKASTQHPFEGITNKTTVDGAGTPSVQISHQGEVVTLQIMDEQSLPMIKRFDDHIFHGFQTISEAELRDVAAAGRVLYITDDAGNVVAETQVLTGPITDHPDLAEDEAYCYGTAIAPEHRGSQYVDVLFGAQEVVAREAGKARMTLTVRVENLSSIRSRLRHGFRITAYDPERYGSLDAGGARLIMEKSLVNEPLPFDKKQMAKRMAEGKIPVLVFFNGEVDTTQKEVAVPVDLAFPIDDAAHRLLSACLAAGYIGTGLLRASEVGEDNTDRSYFILQLKDTDAIVEPLTEEPNLTNEYSRLQRVIVAYPPETSQINPAVTSINNVVEMNVGNFDTLAAKAEFEAFVRALEAEGVEVVRQGALGKNGSTVVFTRDPAFTIGHTFVIGKLGREQRAYETKSFVRLSKNISTLDLSQSAEAVVEGGDVVMLDDGLVLVGVGQRTNMLGVNALQDAFPDYRFLAVPHSDLHLNVLCVVLGKKKLLMDITQLPAEFVQAMHDEGYEVVVADPDEQVTLGCNVVAVNNNRVVAAANNVKTIAAMRAAGVTVIEVAMPNLIKKGGGPRCMTCPTNRE